jgi:hypothetical protein
VHLVVEEPLLELPDGSAPLLAIGRATLALVEPRRSRPVRSGCSSREPAMGGRLGIADLNERQVRRRTRSLLRRDDPDETDRREDRSRR